MHLLSYLFHYGKLNQVGIQAIVSLSTKQSFLFHVKWNSHKVKWNYPSEESLMVPEGKKWPDKSCLIQEL